MVGFENQQLSVMLTKLSSSSLCRLVVPDRGHIRDVGSHSLDLTHELVAHATPVLKQKALVSQAGTSKFTVSASVSNPVQVVGEVPVVDDQVVHSGLDLLLEPGERSMWP